ncbi:MAG TPA: carboxymuconolactone decarboxylase family protein [Vicinamibacteria bacterium]|nr:carboxymuconolactone decarboxylase family protein [Vicinamibacteria bacterium]
MASIRVISEAAAEAGLQAAYRRVSAARGRLANILKVHSVSPEAMTAHLDLYRHAMFGPSELSRVEREAIAVAVSTANACHY